MLQLAMSPYGFPPFPHERSHLGYPSPCPSPSANRPLARRNCTLPSATPTLRLLVAALAVAGVPSASEYAKAAYRGASDLEYSDNRQGVRVSTGKWEGDFPGAPCTQSQGPNRKEANPYGEPLSSWNDMSHTGPLLLWRNGQGVSCNGRGNWSNQGLGMVRMRMQEYWESQTGSAGKPVQNGLVAVYKSASPARGPLDLGGVLPRG